MDAVVAVDGGGSKTDIAVLSTGGRALARIRRGAFAEHVIGRRKTVKRLDAEINVMLADIGSPPVVSASVCFSDIDFPFEVATCTEQLNECEWGKQHLFVDNDTFALLRAGTDEPTAVAVVCGTGMNCVGRTADGRVARFAAIGDVSGDWGGGYGLGTEAIWHAARAADKRGPATMLESLVLHQFGKESMTDVIIGFHTGKISWGRVPSLAPLVFEAAVAGDEIAVGLIDHQADEIVAFTTAALTRLDIMGQKCPVVLGGGVIAARHQCLLGAVDAKLAEKAPGTYSVIVSDPPIVGAALLAFDALGADAGVQGVVRAELARTE